MGQFFMVQLIKQNARAAACFFDVVAFDRQPSASRRVFF